ncbi:serine hydrolase domain-containing protein [Pedobacter aquatilis]|uniref:serine hydrolase domain-containing protein n=1 Tax=Pedobacter aquatilis TaxID=351343 RepID=UPI00292FA336|nr:serine hydrolase domain-containing protein [Pedobacter aquatilis]
MKNHFEIFCICACAMLSMPYTACAQFDSHELTRKLQHVLERDKIPGMAVVLVDHRNIIYKQSFGKADIYANRSYKLSTIQEVGSVSKMILAAALMKSIELGYFSLDTDINQILPFKVINPFDPKHAITIRALATHTSGIKDNQDIYMNTYKFDLNRRTYSPYYEIPLKELGYKKTLRDTTLKEFYFNYLNQQGKYYSPKNFIYDPSGSVASYSNIASALVAYLIEIKSGMSYKTFIAKQIFEPLQITQSAWFTSELKLKKLSRLYIDEENDFPLYDLITYPDGGLKTNAIDLSKFLKDMIAGLNGRSVILNQKSFESMFTPQFSENNKPAKFSLATRNKGILWNLYNNGTIGHDGDDPGISAFLVFNPKNGLGGLFLCNKYLEDKSSLIKILTESINQWHSKVK